MLAAGHEHFGDNDGMTLIGSCPSVGITGYVLGGGAGDISPYVGYGVDIVKKFELVLYDGTVVKASEEENADLYWASRGGGGGNGIVTHLTYKIVQAPEQKYEEENGKKYTLLYLAMNTKDVDKAAKHIQEWLYDADPLITGKFGGAFAWGPGYVAMPFVYLGSWREAMEDLQATGLLDDEIFTVEPRPFTGYGNAILSENYEVLCTSDQSCPQFENGMVSSAYEFNTYAEVELNFMCTEGLFNYGSFEWSNTSGNFCKDLGIADDQCEDDIQKLGIPLRKPKLCNKLVIDAMMEKAGDPSSFMNSHGPSLEFVDATRGSFNATVSGVVQLIQENSLSIAGASMWPRLDDKLFAKILQNHPETSSHLQHGAALKVRSDTTAYPWRNAAFQVQYSSDAAAKSFLELLIKEGVPAQRYYAYLNPPGMKKWRSYFFNDRWKDLTKIRAKYDPKDVFGKPLTIESFGE
ncbi:hypothetical protein CTEN210_06465 [Chaetoceros tenuissimus]|uniref:FAD-binding PCMH-type domain-containing protein n=1 Tax=Chaetoceros tenuissimus TaxID=426638 RepID=A0AAD3CQJ3_9STRA|nr:hypothetical protein CTEN210_06465 [Chaetoceros tenuissimus]